MQAAIDQNTKGVTLLTAGFHHQAAKCFKQALHSLRVACDGLMPTEKWGGSPTRTGTVSFERRLSEDNWSHSYLIHSATDGSYESYTVCSALIMFNLGVAFHYYGYITDARPEVCLQKASLLYNHCLQLMSALPEEYEDEILNLSSAALNHLADVSYTMGDANGVRHALDSLLVLNLRSYLVNEEIIEDEHYSVAPAA